MIVTFLSLSHLPPIQIHELRVRITVTVREHLVADLQNVGVFALYVLQTNVECAGVIPARPNQ